MASTTPLHKFDFDYLFKAAKGQRVTYDLCVRLVGTGIAWYSHQDVYDRVILWRLPLLALWATTTLPAFGFWTQAFTLCHLIADPIDTVWSLLYKLDVARRTTLWTKKRDSTILSFDFNSDQVPNETDTEIQERIDLINQDLHGQGHSRIRSYFHDVPALIITAYDEFGYGEQACKAMEYGFNADRWDSVKRTDLRKRCASAAFLIASDRVSRFLPSAAAALAFFIQLTASFWKTLSTVGDKYDESNPVSAGLNRAPHNIAFGALFFWLPFVVLMTAIVGGSQTSHLVPRVLEDFRKDFEKSHTPPGDTHISPGDTHIPPEDTHIPPGDIELIARRPVLVRMSPTEKPTFPNISKNKYKRWRRGCLPVWQAEKFMTFVDSSNGRLHNRPFAIMAILLSFIIVAIPTGCAVAISWLTPTEGFGCRAMTQISFLFMWIISAVFDAVLSVYGRTPSSDFSNTKGKMNIEQQASILARDHQLYKITFAKDAVCVVGTITTLTLTAMGIFNKCECWCKWPKSSGYISFLQDDTVFHLIRKRLETTFPGIVGFALLFQIIIFCSVWVWFRKGHRVLKQRDIDSVLDKIRESGSR